MAVEIEIKNTLRNRNGASVAELAPVIYAAFFLLVFPLMNLATIGLRYALVMIAAHDAAAEAAIATTFQSGNGTDPSAQAAATAMATRVLGSFRGVKLTATATRIIIANLSTRAVTARSTKLAAPADTSANVYMVEPNLTASIDPLVTLPQNSPFAVPAITAPFTVQVSTRKVAENPQGLNL